MAEQVSRDYKYYSNKRGYIIYSPKHYKNYIESYTGGFVTAAMETASGGTGRFLGMAQGLAGIGSHTQGGIAAKEDVEEKYIRDFLNCGVIDRNSDAIRLDKIMFIYKYGSKKAKKIALDEKLKMM